MDRGRIVYPLIQLAGVLSILTVTVLIWFEQDIVIMSAKYFFWFIMIPLMVLTIFFAPGVWRNVCPLATTNLAYYNLFHKRRVEREGPAANKLSGRMGVAHEFLKKRGALISALLFWSIVPLRLVFLTDDSVATVLLIVGIFSLALLMGILFPVKSGWCTSICPIFSVEKTYSINPPFFARNVRCDYTDANTQQTRPCSACSFNCVDILGTEKTYLMENVSKIQHDTTNAAMRKIFIATFPGFLLGYFLLAFEVDVLGPLTHALPLVLSVYLTIAMCMLMTYLIHATIKSVFRKRIIEHDGELTIEKPNPFYALLKRRLDLVYVAASIGGSWTAFTYGTFHPLALDIAGQLFATGFLIVSMAAMLIVSTLFIVKGWNETLQNEHASWF